METESRCRNGECEWPCTHHAHQELNESEMALVRLPPVEDRNLECRFCDAWYGIVSSRCFCVWNGHDLSAQSHAFIGAEIRTIDLHQRFYGTLDWDCGTVDVELVFEDESNSRAYSLVQQSKEIQANPRSPLALTVYRQWLSTCRVEHKDCNYQDIDGFPKRLVDITDSNSVKIVETGYRRHQYCALSYCWGGKEPLMLLRRNEAQLAAGIPMASLPACFLDAVHIARGLGMRYIWIDALNILQYDTEDWDAESARMAGIYANASFVIIAANSKNPYEGFLDREEHEHQWYSWSLPETRLSIHIRLLFDHHANAAILYPISGRAWTYQERLMARRCLVFGDFETTWECQGGCKCECSGDHAKLREIEKNTSRPQMIPSRATERSSVDLGDFATEKGAFRYWIQAVEIYSALRMTNPDDKLPAMAGIASTIARATGGQYLAGLWQQHLVDFLLWRRVRYSGDIFDRVNLPTWSWASQPGTIRYCPVLLQDREYITRYRAEVVEAKCELNGTNPFGAVHFGHVSLRGRCTPAIVSVLAGIVDEVQPKLTLEATGEEFDLVTSTVNSNESLDFLPVKEFCIVLSDGSTRAALRRAPGDSYTYQESCSGSVMIFWLLDDQVVLNSNKASIFHSYALVLAYSQREHGAYERLGLINARGLRGRVLPMPEISELDTRIELVKII